MPKVEFEPTLKVNFNTVLLICQLATLAWAIFGGAIGWAVNSTTTQVDVTHNTHEIVKLQAANKAVSDRVAEAQEKTASRLTALETQNVYILQSLNRLETTVAQFTTRQ